MKTKQTNSKLEFNKDSLVELNDIQMEKLNGGLVKTTSFISISCFPVTK